MRFGRRKGAAVAERGSDTLAQIEELTAESRESPSPDLERRIRDLRYLAGRELATSAPASPSFADPAPEGPGLGAESRVPEVDGTELDAAGLRSAVLSHGCLLVRGLVDPADATRMAEEIERAFAVRDALPEGDSDADGYYDELQPEPPQVVIGRPWVRDGGGLLAADSPRLLAEMLRLFDEAGLQRTVSEYLGEAPAVSAEKCTLRRTTADLPKAWHQDGKFLGDVRAINVWLSLTRSGDVSPGLDLVPKRLEHHAESGGEGSIIDIEVSQELAEELAAPEGIVRPIFEPGDALLFDDLFLHQTGSSPEMTDTRYAIESWFFGASKFPPGYVPIAP